MVAGGGRPGCQLRDGKVMDKLFEQLPKIIRGAARSRYGILALVVVALSLVGVLLFRDTSEWVRLAMFVLMLGGFAGFVLLVFSRFAPESPPEARPEIPRPAQPSRKAGLQGKGDKALAEAERQRMLGRNDQARAAYGEARTLYKQVEDRLGEANVLLGLGELERTLGRNDQARLSDDSLRHPRSAFRLIFLPVAAFFAQ